MPSPTRDTAAAATAIDDGVTFEPDTLITVPIRQDVNTTDYAWA